VATFDEVNGRKIESLVRSSRLGATSPTAPPFLRPSVAERNVSNAQRQYLKAAVQSLRNYRTTNSMRRVSAIRMLANMVPRTPDVEPQWGADIGAYLLLAKPTEEHNQVMPYVKTLASWRSVRLGLADAVENPRLLRRSHLPELFSAVLGRSVVLAEGDTWKPHIRRELLRSVLDGMAGGSVIARDPSSVYDRASSVLHEYYALQARLVGVLPAKYLSTERPSQVLQQLIDQYAAELSGQVKRPQDRAYLDDLPHHLKAAEYYVGSDDLRYSLMLERIWLRLLALGVVVEHPDRADEADNLVEEFTASDGRAENIVVQLRDGHAAILRLWRLWNRPR
jgi:hypothetical protein